MPFLMQVFVLLFAPLLRLGFLGNHPFLDYYQNAPVTIQSLAWNASSQETPRMPFPSAARSCVWQHRATTSEGRQHRLQIAAPDSSALGHATATTVVTKMPFLMQVFVLLFAPLLRLGFLGNHPFLDYYQNAPFTIQSLAWNASSQETPRMPFASAARSCVWQHRATTSEGASTSPTNSGTRLERLGARHRNDSGHKNALLNAGFRPVVRTIAPPWLPG
ncbi:hypothetical protein MRX96_045956 [Rhipicephalus microplus]